MIEWRGERGCTTLVRSADAEPVNAQNANKESFMGAVMTYRGFVFGFVSFRPFHCIVTRILCSNLTILQADDRVDKFVWSLSHLITAIMDFAKCLRPCVSCTRIVSENMYFYYIWKNKPEVILFYIFDLFFSIVLWLLETLCTILYDILY